MQQRVSCVCACRGLQARRPPARATTPPTTPPMIAPMLLLPPPPVVVSSPPPSSLGVHSTTIVDQESTCSSTVCGLAHLALAKWEGQNLTDCVHARNAHHAPPHRHRPPAHLEPKVGGWVGTVERLVVCRRADGVGVDTRPNRQAVFEKGHQRVGVGGGVAAQGAAAAGRNAVRVLRQPGRGRGRHGLRATPARLQRIVPCAGSGQVRACLAPGRRSSARGLARRQSGRCTGSVTYRIVGLRCSPPPPTRCSCSWIGS